MLDVHDILGYACLALTHGQHLDVSFEACKAVTVVGAMLDGPRTHAMYASQRLDYQLSAN